MYLSQSDHYWISISKVFGYCLKKNLPN